MTLVLKKSILYACFAGVPKVVSYVKIQQTVHLGWKHFMHFSGCVLTSIKKEKKKSKDMAATVGVIIHDLTLKCKCDCLCIWQESSRSQGQTYQPDSNCGEQECCFLPVPLPIWPFFSLCPCPHPLAIIFFFQLYPLLSPLSSSCHCH